MNPTKRDISPGWERLKQQYAEWRKRLGERRISRQAAEAACERFWI